MADSTLLNPLSDQPMTAEQLASLRNTSVLTGVAVGGGLGTVTGAIVLGIAITPAIKNADKLPDGVFTRIQNSLKGSTGRAVLAGVGVATAIAGIVYGYMVGKQDFDERLNRLAKQGITQENGQLTEEVINQSLNEELMGMAQNLDQTLDPNNPNSEIQLALSKAIDEEQMHQQMLKELQGKQI